MVEEGGGGYWIGNGFVEVDEVFYNNMPLLLWYNRNIIYGLPILKYYGDCSYEQIICNDCRNDEVGNIEDDFCFGRVLN